MAEISSTSKSFIRGSNFTESSSNRHRTFAIVGAAAIAVIGTASQAAVKTFDNGPTNAGGYAYLTATNWNDDIVPTASDDVVFDNSLTTLTGQAVTLGGNAVANSWTFGSANGAPLGAFIVKSSSGSAGRTITLTSGNLTVDSSVTGLQSIAPVTGVLTFSSGTGSLNLTNNSTTQALTLGQVIYAAGTNLSFSTAGGAINVDTVQSPTVASLNGGSSNVTLYKNLSGSARNLTINGTAVTATGSHVFGGFIGGTNTTSPTAGLSVTVAGDGTFVQTFNGNNAYGGATTVTSGTLLVNGTQTNSGNVSVSGTIGGSGSFNNTVVRTFTMAAGAKLTPGGSAGTGGTFAVNFAPAVASTVDLSAASNDTGAYVFDLAAPGASDQFKVIAGTNGFNVGTLDFADFSFNALSGFGEGTYILFDGNSNGGTTADQHTLVGTLGTASGTVNGLNAALSFDTANDNVVLTVTNTPEPVSLAVLGMGAAGLLARRRRLA